MRRHQSSPATGRRHAKRLQCTGKRGRQTLPVIIDPMLELGRVTDEDPVQERSSIQGDSVLVAPRLNGGVELGDVRREYVWV